jgi:hypothetical protein
VPNEASNRFRRDESNRGAELDIPSPAYRNRSGAGRDGGVRRLAITAGAIGGVLLLAAGGWWVVGHRSHAVPVIEAQSGPVRVKPENPGGMQVAGADEAILSGEAENGKTALAPPPETPEPQALRAQEPAKAKAAAPVSPPGQAATPPAAPPAAATERGPGAGPHTEAAAPASSGTPPRPAAQALPLPAARPAASTNAPGPVAAMSGRPTAAAEGSTEVQLAAVRSEQAAKAEWGRLEKRMPQLLNGHRPAVIRAERDGHVFFRLRTGGFADTAQATAFCEHVRAKGGGCSLASF